MLGHYMRLENCLPLIGLDFDGRDWPSCSYDQGFIRVDRHLCVVVGIILAVIRCRPLGASKCFVPIKLFLNFKDCFWLSYCKYTSVVLNFTDRGLCSVENVLEFIYKLLLFIYLFDRNLCVIFCNHLSNMRHLLTRVVCMSF